MICNNTFVKQGDEIVSIIALTILLLAGSAGAVPAEEWNRSYEGTAASVLQTSDGGYIVLGSVSESYSNNHVKLVKTDANGNLQWTTKYGEKNIANAIQQTKDGGYIIAGSTYSDGLSDAWIIKTDEKGKELWNRTFGGKEDEDASSVQQTPDEGYIIAGKTHSYGAGSDAWLIKTDPKGNEVWNRTFRTGKDPDGAGTVKVTADGGYILVGSSFYYAWIIKTDADGIKQWNKTLKSDGATIQLTSDSGYILAGLIGVFSSHGADAWLSKIDVNGNELWNRTFGGTEYDAFGSVQETSDSGYILAGRTCVRFDFVQCDAWLIKTDRDGNELWNKTFGDPNNFEEFRSVQQTSDGGYILAGGTYAGRTSPTATNFLIVKVGPKEEVIIPIVVSTPVVTESPEKSKVDFVPYFEEWNKTFGGAGYDTVSSVRQTSDGGYILAGITLSFGGGNEDAWLVKTDANGNELWNKTFERYGHDTSESVQQTSDGGYILVGSTYSSEEKGGVTTNYPPDAWLIKTDLNGNKQWSKTFGGRDIERAYSVQQTSDGGYILAGNTWSYGAGFSDAWLVKTDANGDRMWSKTYGGAEQDEASYVQQTKDGGYIFVGGTDSYVSDVKSMSRVTNDWLVKTDADGNELWNRSFGEADDIKLWDIVEKEVVLPLQTESMQKTSDGGYVFTGQTWLKSGMKGVSGSYYALLKKTDNNYSQEWNMTFGKAERFKAYSISDCEAKSVRQTKDGGYIIAGTTNFYGEGDPDAWLIKLKVKQESNKTMANITGIPTATQPKETIGFEAVFTLAMVLIVSRIKIKAA